jgi:hypothetical protein
MERIKIKNEWHQISDLKMYDLDFEKITR